ncbi:GTP 3',8-cyclase MoaA [candidate division TA06 bacterium]|uniref:GTP 3',8-cyclase n=1 Tax=candidate division TA06 bacterium TaxID=2250710 RepID=A0A933IDH8_UNCT6|nr:GTP 3',8-cyclase MoaA [candidate division TA06 bacterium]
MLVDQYGRKINYLRVSVTDRCNLRCCYCMPQEGVLKKHEEILTFEEIETIVKAGAELGIDKVRLTGGEPLLRKGFIDLVKKLSAIKTIKDLALTTNGILLGPMAAELKSAGINRVNISLDTLRPERFQQMTGSADWQKARDGILAALSAGFKQVKMNVVAIAGYNDDEIVDFIAFVKNKPIGLRFIEFMPVGNAYWESSKMLNSETVKKRIADSVKLIPAVHKNNIAEEFQIEGSPATVGFISPLSQKFCKKCNRLRLTSDGFLKPCLGSKSEVNIKVSLRNGLRGTELRRVFYEALRLKPACHKMNQGAVDIARHMADVGG